MRARASFAVIAFPSDRVRSARREPGQRPGEVVIFSGVRIERMEDSREAVTTQGHLLPPRPRRGSNRKI